MIFAKSMFSNKAQKYIDFQLILMPPNHQILTQKCLQKCAPKLDRIFTIFCLILARLGAPKYGAQPPQNQSGQPLALSWHRFGVTRPNLSHFGWLGLDFLSIWT